MRAAHGVAVMVKVTVVTLVPTSGATLGPVARDIVMMVTAGPSVRTKTTGEEEGGHS